jgi:hypothetical protein
MNTLRLWARYVQEMPEAKTQLIAQVLRMDLHNYGSSRLVRNLP